LGVAACSRTSDDPGPDASSDRSVTPDVPSDSADSSVASDSAADVDEARDGDVSVDAPRDSVVSDGSIDAPRDADASPDRELDASVADASSDTSVPPPTDAPGGSEPRIDVQRPGEFDAHWQDADFGPCTALPPLPAPSSTEARFWFSSSAIKGGIRARARNDVLYAAAMPPFRLDAKAPSLCLLPGPTALDDTTQDILAPAGSSLLVIAYGAGGPRTLLVSADDGRTWSTARQPGIPPSSGHADPVALAASPSQSGVPARLFATYGGSVVDISENGGLDWTRGIEGGSSPMGGFALDTAGETLWLVAELIIDRVGALWASIPASGPLPSMWSSKPFPAWDSNAVYETVADPFDAHAMYLGGRGRLGYLTMVNGAPVIDVPWANRPADPSLPSLSVYAIWADPNQAKHVIWSGSQGGEPVPLLESTEGGLNPQAIPLEGFTDSYVTSISYLPTLSKLVILARRWSSKTLEVYVLDR